MYLESNKILTGDCFKLLKQLPDKSVDCCITSPPYYQLRDYHHPEQIGQEETPEKYITKLVDIFKEVKRILKDQGTLWIVIGDSYNGSNKANGDKFIDNYLQKSNKHSVGIKPTRVKTLKSKDLIGIPWMLAFALRADGWFLRQDIIWHKKNPMPESVKDRCTKAHEYIFLFSKSKKYHFDYKAIMEEANYDGRRDTRAKGSHKYSQNTTGLYPQTFAAREHERWTVVDGKYMRNKRSVWQVNTKPFKDAHFAVFPEQLITDCLKAGCPENGIVLDPFMGSGTTACVAKKINRNYLGIEINPEYVEIANKRIACNQYDIKIKEVLNAGKQVKKAIKKIQEIAELNAELTERNIKIDSFIRNLQETISIVTQISHEKYLSDCRTRECILCRMLFVACANRIHLNYYEIATLIGRHRTNIYHILKKHDEESFCNATYRKQYMTICRMLGLDN